MAGVIRDPLGTCSSLNLVLFSMKNTENSS